MKLAPAFMAGRKKVNDFDGREPANTPPAGYIWTNARAAGIVVRNYGITELGQLQTGVDGTKNFLDDLKAGDMPRLVVMPAGPSDVVEAALKNSKFGPATEVITGDLRKVEALLGLRPMTRKD